MPRTGRGGKRAGTPGTSYANRSDLNTRRVLPAQAAPNLPYGEAGQLKNAQQAVPMASAPPTSVGVPSTEGGPPGPTPSSAGPGVPPPPQPGQAGAFTRPTDRPDEPVSTPPLLPSPAQTTADLFDQLAAGPGANSAVAAMAAALRSGFG